VTKANIALLRVEGGQVSAQTGSVDGSAKAEGGAFAVKSLHTRVLFAVPHVQGRSVRRGALLQGAPLIPRASIA
jgi:hypothetical protein